MRIARADVKRLAPIAAICQQIIMKDAKESKKLEKADRLAEALRANLRRRKKNVKKEEADGGKTEG